ncbi:MAG: methyltransferase domain-containing protein [Treponema sp.]|jgi:SAM-dependent methyltransferase|nr:methyltransferase domain-containing protein [Treponema sp.]
MNTKNDSIVNQMYWDDGYEKQQLEVASENDPIRKLIMKYIPRGGGGGIEIGAYPCRYLAIFGELGYTLNGIDTTEKIESNELKDWIKQNNWNYEILRKINFLDFKTDKKFDIVCSFGFIEHFEKWDEIIRKHAVLVKEGGYLILSTPNFAGLLQRILHVLTDIYNYKRHIIQSMNPKKWMDVLGKNYKIIYIGYFDSFMFWVGDQKRNIIQKLIVKCFSVLGKILKKFPNCGVYSPFCGLIVKKLS